VCIILIFLAAPLYYLYLYLTEKYSGFVDLDGADYLIHFDGEGHVDASHAYRTAFERYSRRLVSVLVMVFLLGIQAVATVFLTRTDSTNIGIYFAVSIVSAALNTIFAFICGPLTNFERWTYYDMYNSSWTIKLLLFRLVNIVTVYAATNYEATRNVKCTHATIAGQFITLLLVEIVWSNMMKIFLGMLYFRYHATFARWTGSILGDHDNMCQFDLANQYLSAFYLFYLTSMSMTTIPFSTFLALFGFVVKYWVDKFYLYKLCGEPRKVETSLRLFVSVTLFVVQIVALLTPYAGSAFVLGAITKRLSPFCLFP